MDIPEKLSAALAAADENYLTGLCNKGTVNRAKKDLAALTAPETVPEQDGVTVRLGDISCFITVPLGESRCSCPSSAICRHRIAAILWLKGQLDAQPAGAPAPPPKPEFQELRDYPTEKLAKQLGAKRLSAALFRHQSGGGPEIGETSVVTVDMPWIPASVRLLGPLEHSSCTCHSKTFCVHKAEALLYWQLKEKIADPALLQTTQPAGAALDLETVRGVCQAVQETLAAQLASGLSRMPPGVCETVERMASLCHTAKLPELERALRGLHGEYAAYFARSATYRDAALLQRISETFRLAAALEAADGESAPALAGAFREDYLPIGDLKLYLLGMREFSGRGGYAGTIYYFWERDAHQFYTFTHVRPTFYETNARRRGPAVPWGLPCPLHQVWNCALDLNGAKATRTGNLSASEQCQATLLGPQDPGGVFPGGSIYTGFELLFQQKSTPHAPERERLAVVRPQRCEPQPYDTVQQCFTLRLLDGEGRDLWLEVRYKKEEEEKVVDKLERLSGSLNQDPSLSPVFFGIVYREGDRLKLFPIEYFTEWGHGG